MAGSALKRNPYFNGQAPANAPQYAPMPQYGQQGAQGGHAAQGGYAPQGGGYGQQAPYGAPSPQAMDHQFNLPSATPDQMDRMSYPDVIAKTAGLFAGLIVVAAITWAITWFVNPGLGMVLAGVGIVGSLIIGIAMMFVKTPKPALTWLFAVCEGLLVGGLSAVLELVYPGIVMQATLATFAVVGTVLVLFRFGKVRTSPKLTKIVMVAMIGYAVFSLFNLGYMWIGSMMGLDVPAWGVRGMDIPGTNIPFGLVIGILAILMGAYMLVMDFELIENGVKAGAPRAFGWIAAYSLISTVVFIYIEILRLIAILRGND